jgi:hypothetical protein
LGVADDRLQSSGFGPRCFSTEFGDFDTDHATVAVQQKVRSFVVDTSAGMAS